MKDLIFFVHFSRYFSMFFSSRSEIALYTFCHVMLLNVKKEFRTFLFILKKTATKDTGKLKKFMQFSIKRMKYTNL